MDDGWMDRVISFSLLYFICTFVRRACALVRGLVG